MTMCEDYARQRLRGKGSRQAARLAGFSGGVPSPQARHFWKVVCAVKEISGLEDAARLEARNVVKRDRRLRATARTLRDIGAAKAILAEENS